MATVDLGVPQEEASDWSGRGCCPGRYVNKHARRAHMARAVVVDGQSQHAFAYQVLTSFAPIPAVAIAVGIALAVTLGGSSSSPGMRVLLAEQLHFNAFRNEAELFRAL